MQALISAFLTSSQMLLVPGLPFELKNLKLCLHVEIGNNI